jgi:hypothetical protein
MTIAERTLQLKNDFDDVYQAGKESGQVDAYHRFWDAYQEKGKRNNYNYAFAGYGWTDATFKPKYDIMPNSVNAKYLFANCKIIDLSQAVASSGRTLDVSAATNFQNMFSYAYCEKIPSINISNATDTSGMFNGAKVITIEGLVVGETTTFAQSTFAGATLLENLTFSGTIAKSLPISACTKLSKASITSIINTLSSTTSNLAVTLSKTAVNNAFETAEGLADGSTSTEWSALVATKTNWTVSLV